MKNILKVIVKKPVTICMVILILLVSGILATSNMSVNLLPDMNMPFLGVQIVYPGASADVVEKDVTLTLENELHSLSEVSSISTYSIDNASIAVISFDYGTNLDKKTTELNDKLGNLVLPSDCSEPKIITVDLNSEAVVTFTLTDDTNNVEKLSEDAKKLQSLFYQISGVGSVDIIGSPTKTINITSLNGLDITSLLIVEALSSENLDIPFGTIMEDGNVVSLRNASDITSLDELKSLPIKLQLDEGVFEKFDSFKSLINTYETISIAQYSQYVSMLTSLNQVCALIDSFDYATLSKFYERILISQSIMSLVDNNSDTEIMDLWNNSYAEVVGESNFSSLSNEELIKIATDKSLDLYLLLWSQGLNDASGEWEKLSQFKTTNPNIKNSEKEEHDLAYATLFDSDAGHLNLFGDIINIPLPTTAVFSLISYFDQISFDSLEDIIEAKKNNEAITNEEYVKLFNSPQLNSMLISFVRSSSFTLNMNSITKLKQKQISESNRAFTNEEIVDLFNSLNLDNDLGFNVTVDVINFIRNVDFAAVNVKNSIGTLILPLEKIGHIDVVNTYSSFATYNGKLSVNVSVYANGNANTTEIVEEAKKVVLNNEFDSSINLLNDKAEFINDSISNILVSIIIGGILAVIVIFLFLRKIKTSIIVSITMPLSILVALLCLWLMDISLNMVSLGGLAVGIGMLVDNSIVVIENITKHHSSGESALESSVNGTSEVAVSLFASTLTNVCVFFPILFINGITKEIFSNLVFSVLYSIVMSLIVALFIIPTLYYLVYKKSDKNINVKESNKIKNFEEKYQKLLGKILYKKGLVCILAVALFVCSVLLVFTTGTEFLPSIDKGLIEVAMTYSPTTTLEEANEKSLEMVDLINDKDDIEYISMSVGKQGLLATEISSIIRVQLSSSNISTSDFAQEIRTLSKEITGVKTINVTEIDGVVAEVTSGFSSLSAIFVGDDITRLEELVKEFEREVLTHDGIVYAIDDLSSKTKEYNYHIDKEKCLKYDIDYTTIVSLLRVAVSGYDATNIVIDDESIIVNVKFSSLTLSDIETLNNTIIGFSDEGSIKVKDVSTIEEKSVNTVIKRSDGKYSVSIDLQTYNLSSGESSNIIKTVANNCLKNYEGYSYVESGITSYLNEAFSGLLIALIIAFFLLYAVLASQFESLLKPIIVIASIPFAFTGGFLALFITNTSLNVVSFIGIIMLMGVIVNNAIIMIDKIDSLIKEGVDKFDAVKIGASSRLRAILMTTLTTILALVPLSLGLGSGGELMQPMGIVVLGGLLLGTLVTLIIIPSFYCIVNKVKCPIKKQEKLEKEVK